MMSSAHRLVLLSVVAATLGSSHVVVAQGAEGIQARDVSTTARASAAPAPEVERVADSKKADHTKGHLDRMREILTRVLEHLEDAREERDVVKLNCVNEKLTAIKGLLKISEQADVTMQEALARRNSEVAEHEFEKIAIARSKSEQLMAESEACVGELAVYSGETEVDVEVDDDVVTEDATGNTGAVGEVITAGEEGRPPVASPYGTSG